MNPIEFGAELFRTADELQAKTIKALEVIAKIDEKLGAMPEQFKIPIICAVTEAVLECENVSNALAQEPCDDCISRQASIDAIFAEPLYKPGMKKRYAEEVVPAIFEKIKSLPPITSQPKTGHWIDIMVGDMPAQVCDQCKTFYPLSYTGGGHNYCPSCGSRMVEPIADKPQGEWIEVTNGRGGHECNQCGEYAPSYQSGDEYLSKFYPNCGAKMVEPQESGGGTQHDD